MNQKLINSYLSVLCPLCNKHSNIITDQNSGELICPTCGSVIIDNTEAARSEWTSNIQELDFRDRTGAPTSLAKYDRGLSTVIGKIDKDASGRQIDLAMKSRIGRWRTLGSEIAYKRFFKEESPICVYSVIHDQRCSWDCLNQQ